TFVQLENFILASTGLFPFIIYTVLPVIGAPEVRIILLFIVFEDSFALLSFNLISEMSIPSLPDITFLFTVPIGLFILYVNLSPTSTPCAVETKYFVPEPETLAPIVAASFLDESSGSDL